MTLEWSVIHLVLARDLFCISPIVRFGPAKKRYSIKRYSVYVDLTHSAPFRRRVNIKLLLSITKSVWNITYFDQSAILYRTYYIICSILYLHHWAVKSKSEKSVLVAIYARYLGFVWVARVYFDLDRFFRFWFYCPMMLIGRPALKGIPAVVK